MITMSEQAKAQAYHVVRSGFQAQGDGQESKSTQYKPMLWDLEFEAQMRWLDSKVRPLSPNDCILIPIFYSDSKLDINSKLEIELGSFFRDKVKN